MIFDSSRDFQCPHSVRGCEFIGTNQKEIETHLTQCKFEYVFTFLREKERELGAKNDPANKEQLELLKEVLNRDAIEQQETKKKEEKEKQLQPVSSLSVAQEKLQSVAQKVQSELHKMNEQYQIDQKAKMGLTVAMMSIENTQKSITETATWKGAKENLQAAKTEIFQGMQDASFMDIFMAGMKEMADDFRELTGRQVAQNYEPEANANPNNATNTSSTSQNATTTKTKSRSNSKGEVKRTNTGGSTNVGTKQANEQSENKEEPQHIQPIKKKKSHEKYDPEWDEDAPKRPLKRSGVSEVKVFGGLTDSSLSTETGTTTTNINTNTTTTNNEVLTPSIGNSPMNIETQNATNSTSIVSNEQAKSNPTTPNNGDLKKSKEDPNIISIPTLNPALFTIADEGDEQSFVN